MKKYLMLRDNQESGPYELEELIEKGIWKTDLFWVEGKSTAWSFPLEMAELKDHVSAKEPRIFISRPVREPEADVATLHESGDVSMQTNICQPLDELKERLHEFEQEGPVWNRQASRMQDILKVAAVFSGLVVGAFLIKKAVDGFSSLPLAETNALPAYVMAEETLPDPQYKTALLTEVLPVRETPKVVKKVKPRDIKKQLSISGSDYKVGLLGGINGLTLKIRNASPHSVDKVTLAVQYMKPKGEIVHTDYFELFSIKPFGAKSLQVPDSKRGVKVTYKIVEVKSKDYSQALKQV